MAIYRVLITPKIKHGQIKRNFLSHRTSLPTHERNLGSVWSSIWIGESSVTCVCMCVCVPWHSGGWTRKVLQWKATAISLSLSFIFVLVVLPRRLSCQVRERARIRWLGRRWTHCVCQMRRDSLFESNNCSATIANSIYNRHFSSPRCRVDVVSICD